MKSTSFKPNPNFKSNWVPKEDIMARVKEVKQYLKQVDDDDELTFVQKEKLTGISCWMIQADPIK